MSRPPKEMETLEERIRSRFEWGLLADIGSPDYETRMAILRKKEELDGVSLDDAILNYIALNIKSNIRELEGALNKLVAYENPWCRQRLRWRLQRRSFRILFLRIFLLEVTPQLVVEVVAEHFGITMDQITSKSRSNDVAKPAADRHVSVQNMTDASLETIGKAVGGRVIPQSFMGKKVGDDISTDTSVERLVATIRKKINPH